MKPVRTLAAAIAAASLSTAYAGEAVFYVTEDGAAASNLAVTVDGKKKLVGKSGFVSFDLDGGNHSVEISEFGEWVGDFQFNAAKNQNAEIQVEMIGGEAVEEVSVYTPGQEQAPAVGKISGNLESEETGGGVAGARISIEGTDLAITTDNDGYYELELPRGEYTLTIADPNYGKREVKNLRVMSNVATSVNMTMSLSGDGVIEEVVAVGSYIPSTATAQERDSSAVLDAIGSEQFARFGDSNAASALKRVAGVSVVGGQFAVVRGMQGRYISSTLNGSLMPSTDPMRRDVPLDLFPASVLGGIEIQKSYTPDLPGDTTGGAIRMTTKGLPDEEVSKLTVGLGYNTQTTGKDVVSYKGGSTDFLGVDDGTREVPSSVDSITNGGQDGDILGDRCETGQPNCEISFADSGALVGDFENIYNVKETTADPNASISYSFARPAEENGIGYYGAFEYKNKWSSREDGKIDDTSGEYEYERSKQNVDLTGYFVIGKEFQSGSELLSKTVLLRKTDDTVKAVQGVDSEEIRIEEYTFQWVERQFLSQQFSGVNYIGDNHEFSWRAGYSQTNRYEPDRRTYQFRNNVIAPSTLERRFSELVEDSYDFGMDYKGSFEFGDTGLLTAKTGVLVSMKEREVDLSRYSVGRNFNVDVPVSDNLEDTLSDENLANGAFFLNLSTTDTDSYGATDNMLAFYGSAEIEFMDNFTAFAGARLEDAEQELTYDRKPSANNKLTSSEVLPVVSLTWRATEDLQFRAGISNTVSRPGLTELSESSMYDPDTDEVIIGNPDLEISKITNLDLRAEYYFSDDENISLALFSKDIADPIEKTFTSASGSSNGITHENSKEAEVLGVELDFRINVLDTDELSGFFSGNLSWVDAEVTLDEEAARLEGVSSRQLQGQSEYLGNMQLGLDHLATGQSFTFLINYHDERIKAVSRGVLKPEMEKERMTMDIVYQWDFSDELVVKAKAANITNEPVAYTQDGREIESYKEGTEVSTSLSYIF